MEAAGADALDIHQREDSNMMVISTYPGCAYYEGVRPCV